MPENADHAVVLFCFSADRSAQFGKKVVDIPGCGAFGLGAEQVLFRRLARIGKLKGGPVVVKNGRYGPYVSHNGINATITGDKTPDTITLTEAIVLLDARAEQLGSQPRRAAGRKKSGVPSEAPKGRGKKATEKPDAAEKSAKPRKKPAKKAAKIAAAE